MRVVPSLALLAALGLVAWLALRARAPVEVTPGEEASSRSDATAPSPLAVSMGDGELAAGASRPRAPVVARQPGATVVVTGSLVVTLVPPEGAARPASVSFDAQPLDFKESRKSLPLEQENGSWRYEALAVGRWRVRAFAPGFVDASQVVTVRADDEVALAIPLEAGGAASWKVTVGTGDAPETIRLALLDGRGIPIEGTYQTPGTTLHALPNEVPALAPEGTVLGLRRGKYRLRASTADGYPSEQTFEVKPGETVAVEFRLVR